MTTWRPIPGYEGIYEASDAGSVRSVARCVMRKNGSPNSVQQRELRTRSTYSGYRVVDLRANDKSRTFTVHKLVALTFYGPRAAGMEVRHLDGDKANNAASNLRYGTKQENVADGHALGEFAYGTRNGSAVLTDDQAREIRSATGPQTAIAARYGVTQTLVSQIKARKIWRHV